MSVGDWIGLIGVGSVPLMAVLASWVSQRTEITRLNAEMKALEARIDRRELGDEAFRVFVRQKLEEIGQSMHALQIELVQARKA